LRGGGEDVHNLCITVGTRKALKYLAKTPLWGIVAPMKRNYQPKKKKRASTHGFRARLASKTGRRVLLRRRRKGRARLAL